MWFSDESGAKGRTKEWTDGRTSCWGRAGVVGMHHVCHPEAGMAQTAAACRSRVLYQATSKHATEKIICTPATVMELILALYLVTNRAISSHMNV